MIYVTLPDGNFHRASRKIAELLHQVWILRRWQLNKAKFEHEAVSTVK
jgi:hypothetical protein